MQASLTLTNHSLVPRVPLLPFSLLLRGRRETLATRLRQRKKHANDAKAWQKACEQGIIVYLQNEF